MFPTRGRQSQDQRGEKKKMLLYVIKCYIATDVDRKTESSHVDNYGMETRQLDSRTVLATTAW